MSDAKAESAAPSILVTAGPTHEPIDAVRFIGNRSSGRMGIAIASSAARRGLATTLLLGPTALPPPPESTSLTLERFRTAADLGEALERLWPHADVLIMAAAVADFRPDHRLVDPGEKLRRKDGRLTIDLEPTPDLLAAASACAEPGQAIVGFALEPEADLLESAREKLERKHVDAIVANPLETMDAETVTARLLLANGEVLAPGADLAKSEFAEWLLDRLLDRLGAIRTQAPRGAARPGPAP